MPKTVLIADESVTIRSVAESLLRGESYSVHSAADGNMALELAQAEMPDLALIGEKLAGLSGPEVLVAIKADPALQKIPVIFMRTDHPGMQPDQADAVLTKPFSPQALLDAVHRFLAGEMIRSEAPDLNELSEERLEDEIIDHALGLDDVGSMPAEERQVGGISKDTDFDLESPPTGDSEDGQEDGQEEAHEVLTPFGQIGPGDAPAAEDDASGEDQGFGHVSMDASSLESTAPRPAEPAPPSQPKPPVSGQSSEIDRALEAAFGAFEEGPKSHSRPGVSPAAPKDPESSSPHSSLEEISLSETGVVPVPPGPAAEEGPPSQRPPDQGIDLGGAESPDEALQDEVKPHDYDWFINEIQKVAQGGTGAKPPAPEPPSIEPVQSAPRAEDTPKPASSDSPSEARTSSEINIDADELAESRRGYDDFISEFRREIARLEGVVGPNESAPAKEPATSDIGKIATEPPIADVPASTPVAPAPTAQPDQRVMEMSDRLIETVTALVARELAAKLDSKTIYALLEQKLKDVQKNPGA